MSLESISALFIELLLEGFEKIDFEVRYRMQFVHSAPNSNWTVLLFSFCNISTIVLSIMPYYISYLLWGSPNYKYILTNQTKLGSVCDNDAYTISPFWNQNCVLYLNRLTNSKTHCLPKTHHKSEKWYIKLMVIIWYNDVYSKYVSFVLYHVIRTQRLYHLS